MADDVVMETPTERTSPMTHEDQAGALVGRLFAASLGAFEVLSVYMGDRLGLYRSLDGSGGLTPGGLAERAGIHRRYAREWLEQQAVAGILEVDDPARPEDERRYTLPPGHAEALTNLDSPFSISPVARTVVSTAQTMPEVMRAFRTGKGVSWSAYGPDMIESQGDFNRPWLQASLGAEYLPAVPDVDERLRRDPPARVADVACGAGWASIAIASAYPNVRVDGFDPDPSSIEIARGMAERAGVADRVRFEVRDGAALKGEGPYDLVIVIEAIHDLSRPVDVLRSIHDSLAPGGTLIVADERVGESFSAPGDEVERFMYAASVTICLPCGMDDEVSAATGTVMRPGKLRQYAEEAGFRDVQILDAIHHDMLRFYRLVP